mmetsp:Transcript_52788/g.125662  ORF Transcript_52788/g.125662 Transcript_52788/m.125662 type:complete len:235 (+) Transcript_52788:834-1538(+)
MPGDLQHLHGHRRREKPHLDLGREELEHVVNLVLETPREHLIGLVEHEDLHGVRAECAAVDHVVHAPRRPHNNLDARLELPDVVAHVGPADARVAHNVHVIPERQHHLLDLLGELARGREEQRLAVTLAHVHALQAPDRERRRLTGTGLGLRDGVAPLDQRQGPALLDRRRLLETVGKDPAQQVLVEAHVIERLRDRVPVGLDIRISEVRVEPRPVHAVVHLTRTVTISHIADA